MNTAIGAKAESPSVLVVMERGGHVCPLVSLWPRFHVNLGPEPRSVALWSPRGYVLGAPGTHSGPSAEAASLNGATTALYLADGWQIDILMGF